MTTKAKPVTPLQEAQKLASALAKIDSRESVARSNMEERYQAERNELLGAASPAAIRVYEASLSEVAG